MSSGDLSMTPQPKAERPHEEPSKCEACEGTGWINTMDPAERQEATRCEDCLTRAFALQRIEGAIEALSDFRNKADWNNITASEPLDRVQKMIRELEAKKKELSK